MTIDSATDTTIEDRLKQRLGPVHARQRLGIENAHQQEVCSWSSMFFHRENWYSLHSLIRNSLRMVGLYRRGQRNATQIELRHHHFQLPALPSAFEGFRILHLSDLHLDMYPEATHALIEKLRTVDYDLCVMTGDYRALTFGSIKSTMQYLAAVRTHLKNPVYAVLGNHDSIRMVPPMEDMGITLLLNESQTIQRNGQSIVLAGIDDAHFFRVDNIEKTASTTADNSVKILLSHTPEVYRQAAHAGFDVFLCGHTHGGQICLPGGIPLTLDVNCPRYLGKGAWRYHHMQGYTSCGAGTSIVNVRFNCPPEITLHTLHCGPHP
ncbi:MAG: metallophosphoesterase [Pseudomonadales bacterium]